MVASHDVRSRKKYQSGKILQENIMKQFLTKSGKPITIGTGTGTKWQWAKKATDDKYFQPVIDQLKLSIKCGYNHIDTADTYTTCPEVGKAIKESGVAREDIWITTKYAAFTIQGRRAPETITLAFNQMLEELETDYVDAFLIHSPFIDEDYDYTLTTLWQELLELYNTGKIRYIGGSNFSANHLKLVSSLHETVKPVMNQIEFHPNLQNQSKNIVQFCKDNDILVEGYNPLCSLFKFKDENLSNYIGELVKKYGKTDSQIILKWVLQMGVLPVTTSSNEDRIKQSLTLDFDLTEEEMKEICDIGAKNKQRFFFLDFDEQDL